MDEKRSAEKAEILTNLRLRTAELSVGASTVRGLGVPGVVRAARSALKRVNLKRFRVRSRQAFRRALDRETEVIRRSLPRGAQHWGVARKVLNVFLRNIVHNRHLSEAFGVRHIDEWLELPLDRQVGEGIRAEREGAHLPRWHTIKGLEPRVGEDFQEAARAHAAVVGVSSILLEYLWWRAGGKTATHPRTRKR